MTHWELSDGTVVHLGGKVEGGSPLAAKLRTAANDAKAGAPDLLCIGPQPGYRELLDLDNAQLVNVWVRQQAARAGVFVRRAHEVEPWPDDERDATDAIDPDGRQRIY